MIRCRRSRCAIPSSATGIARSAHTSRASGGLPTPVHFDRARRLVPDHPGVLYGEACLQETLGAPRIQNYVRVTTLPNGLFIEGVSSPPTHYRRAESLLRKALAADPELVEASLRLGRVLTQLQRPDEALPHLRNAIASATDPAITYYAHLFMGDATQALGQLDEARRQYQNAIAIFRIRKRRGWRLASS